MATANRRERKEEEEAAAEKDQIVAKATAGIKHGNPHQSFISSSSNNSNCTDDRLLPLYHQFHVYRIDMDRDRDAAFEFMQSDFRIQEPITDAIKCSALDTFDFYKDICAECFKHQYSWIARDTSSSSSDHQLAAIALNSIWQRGMDKNKTAGTTKETIAGEERMNCNKNGHFNAAATEMNRQMEFGEAIRHGPYKPVNANRLVIFLDQLEKDFPALLPPTAHQIMKVDILAVHPHYTRRGLASHLLSKSIENARAARCSHVLTTATAVASQNLFRKFGFKTARRIGFNEFLEDGTPVYRNLHDNGTAAELMMLEL